MILGMVALVMAAATLPAVVARFYPPVPPRRGSSPPRAVVVLGAGRRRDGDGYRLNTLGLKRLRVALELARERQLPLLLCGGAPGAEALLPEQSEAALMAEVVRRTWPDAPLMLEPESRNTWENAVMAARVLRLRGIESLVLVTDQAHLCRATLCFQAQHLEVTSHAVTSLPRRPWMPSAGALSQMPVIWREWLALIWYHCKYPL
ncbi:hypothetical protein B5T_01089 [Alloalcanivorax dieselolei B5]|uniref:DUF218 domain-containing protein n=2 Tax=Alloalcanivorax dieselolei TaxID=285091 RepID=K0C9U7_ALCDB|nr:hypothetical protein B5T_01089 [Alloalcanivorax dieselolei B5]